MLHRTNGGRTLWGMSVRIEVIFVCIVIGLYLVYKLTTWSQEWWAKSKLNCVDTTHGLKMCVRGRDKRPNGPNTKHAANLLSIVVNKCERFVDHMKTVAPSDPRVVNLHSRFNANNIRETLPTSDLTAYSQNKGEVMAFCLNDGDDNLIDENTLMFVAIHELAHLTTDTVGHGEDFWSNMKFLLEAAVAANFYMPVDYSKSPKNYCGLEITDSPLFT